jgi:antitoxin ParD1/3/4
LVPSWAVDRYRETAFPAKFEIMVTIKSTSISLGEHFTEFVGAQVRDGRYRSASDVVQAGLRLLEEREARARALCEALIAGETSGEPAPFDNEAFLARMRAAQDG